MRKWAAVQVLWGRQINAYPTVLIILTQTLKELS